MWEISDNKKVEKHVALIEGDQEDLLFYDMPILFTGFNILENRVIGSYIGTDRNKENECYIHAVVDEAVYFNFINRKKNYPDTLREAQLLYIVHWYNAEQSPNVYQIKFDDIPVEYRPKVDAFCPQINHPASFIYPIKLQGGKANNHQVRPEAISELNSKLAIILESPHKRIANIDTEILIQASPETSQAYLESSFKFNYLVKIRERQFSLFPKENDYADFIKNFIEYCLNDLPQEAIALSEEKFDETLYFESLWQKYRQLASISNEKEAKIKRELVNDLLDTAKCLGEISNTVGDDYKEIVLSNWDGVSEQMLGVIDDGFKNNIEEALEKISRKDEQQVEKDSQPQIYEIHIYDFNTNTRKGRALHEHPVQGKIAKPSITILGDAMLTGTKYTESLHEDKYIKITGQATKVDGVVKHIDIIYES